MFLNKIKDKYHYNLLNKFIESGDINEVKKRLEKKIETETDEYKRAFLW